MNKVYALAIKDSDLTDIEPHKLVTFETQEKRSEYVRNMLQDNMCIEFSLAEWDRDWEKGDKYAD